jgi:hypothetical protein
VELVQLFVELVFQDVFQMELNVLLNQFVQHIQPKYHAIQVEQMEFVPLLPLDQENAKL